jgi:hypothetical protein
MKKNVVILMTGFTWLVSACTSFSSLPPQISDETSGSSATIARYPSLTSTTLPSQTPSHTPSKAFTPRPSPTSTQTTMPTSNWQATYVAMKGAVMTATPAVLSEIHISPDGMWQVELIQFGCVNIGADEGVKNSYEQLRLVNIKDGTEMLITDQLQYCGGLGAAGLGFVYWSPNSRYLYYTESAYGVPDGGGMAWYRSLFRYDVINGATIDLRWGPLSPDGVTMAFPDQKELVLFLSNLDTGEIARIPAYLLTPSQLWPGIYDITWSADGKSIVYIEAENSEGGRGKSWIIQLNVASLDRKVIYEAEDIQLCCLIWINSSRIQFYIGSEVKFINLQSAEPGNE